MSTEPTTTSTLPTVLTDAARGAEHTWEDVWDNVRDYLTHGHLADTRRMPRTVVRRGEGFVVHRYDPLPDAATPLTTLAPLLLVPPLGAPDFAFDLRRGARSSS